MSFLNQPLRSGEWMKWSPTTALDCKPNYPSQYIKKCVENSMENMHADVKV